VRRSIPSQRYEIVALVGQILRSEGITADDYSFASALMTRYAINAEELNR
jgi:hypothetical protein